MKVYMRTREFCEEEDGGDAWMQALFLVDEDNQFGLNDDQTWFYTTKGILNYCVKERDVIYIGEL